jgi:predicted HTH transcriptional regulator
MEPGVFDSPEELLAKIRLGEDTSFEMKAVVLKGTKVAGPGRDELADELAAMANTADGVCLLGVDDKGRDILGIPLEKLDLVEAFVREVCNDSVDPPLTVRIARLELPDTLGTPRPVIKVDVPRSLFVHKSPGGYFHRIGSSKRELKPDLLARLFQQRSQARNIRFEEQAVPETTAADLDEELRRRFVSGQQPDLLGTLRKMKLLTLDDAGIERATVAGLLLCSHHPETSLPSAYIEAVRYRGTRQDSNYQLDAAQITGPIDRQIGEALAFVRRNMTVAAIKTPERQEIPQFSVRAVFEAIVNAVAHRDYSVHGSKIRLFIFDDRLELYSPGSLPNSVTIDTLPLRQSTRNELITSLLARCPVGDPAAEVGRRYLMERRGDGVPIIMSETEALSGRAAVYRLIGDAELLLIMWAARLPDHSDAT